MNSNFDAAVFSKKMFQEFTHVHFLCFWNARSKNFAKYVDKIFTINIKFGNFVIYLLDITFATFYHE